MVLKKRGQRGIPQWPRFFSCSLHSQLQDKLAVARTLAVKGKPTANDSLQLWSVAKQLSACRQLFAKQTTKNPGFFVEAGVFINRTLSGYSFAISKSRRTFFQGQIPFSSQGTQVLSTGRNSKWQYRRGDAGRFYTQFFDRWLFQMLLPHRARCSRRRCRGYM